MKNKIKKLTYIILVVFLLAMGVMTIVSRVINESYVPIVETMTSKSGFLKVNAVGRGVIQFGTFSDERMDNKVFVEDTYYVKGIFYEEDFLDYVALGEDVWISVDGGNSVVQGKLAAKMYDYKEDFIEAVVFLEEGQYTVGTPVEFVLEKAKVRGNCLIPNETIYEDEDGNNYVYLLQQRDSITGNSTIAVKTFVHVLVWGDSKASIEEELDANVKLIVRNEILKDGLKVREKEW